MKKVVKTSSRKMKLVLSSLIAVALTSTAFMQPAKAAPVEITYWSYHYLKGTVDATEALVKDFNSKNPNIKVKIVYTDPNNYLDKLTTAFAGGTAPDVFTSEAASIVNYAKQGYLANLNSEMRTIKSDIQPALWNISSYRARLYGVPMMTQTYVVFANVDKFKEAGISIPKGTNTFTWDQFQAIAKKLTTSSQYGVGWGLKSPAATFMIMSQNFGGNFFRAITTENPQIHVSNSELQVPTRVWNMIYSDKSVDPASILGSGGSTIAPFIAGKYAMIVGGSYVASDLDVAAKEKGFNWTALPLLTGTSNKQGANPQTLSISSQSKYKKESATFIRYLMQSSNLTKMALGESLIPATNSASKAAIAAKAGNAGWTQIFDDAGSFSSAPFVLLANYQKWKDTVAQPTWQQWVQGKINKSTMIERLQNGWKSLS